MSPPPASLPATLHELLDAASLIYLTGDDMLDRVNQLQSEPLDLCGADARDRVSVPSRFTGWQQREASKRNFEKMRDLLGGADL